MTEHGAREERRPLGSADLLRRPARLLRARPSPGAGIDPTRLYITYFEGNAELGVEPDNEAKRLWMKYVPESRILPFGARSRHPHVAPPPPPP